MIDAAAEARRFEALKTARSTWESHWQDLGDYVLPGRGQINVARSPGQKLRNKIFDATAVEANELLAAGLHGMLSSPNEIWFNLTLTGDELASDREVGGWLSKVTQITHDRLNATNFQTEIHEVYLDLGCFGTACLLVEEDEALDVRFRAINIADLFVVENARGLIDQLYLQHRYTAAQAQEMADEEGWTLSPKMLKALADNKPDDSFAVVQVIKPRPARDPRRGDSRNMPFASAYFVPDEKHVLHEGGFQEWPAPTPRWTKAAGETYGRSPSMKALADIKMLNEMSKTTLRAAQKAVDPPLLVADDGVLLPVRTAPASLNYARFLADGGDPIRPLKTGTDIGLGLEMENQRRDAIRNAYFFQQMQLRQGPQMTATEVVQRTEESMRLMGPILGRQHFELLRPLIDRVFAILLRRGAFPPVPEILAGRDIDVQYVSPIAKAQKATQSLGLLRALETAAVVANANPEVLDNIDGDATLRYLMDANSVPPALLRAPEKVREMREARAQAAQQEQSRAAMVEIAEAAGKGAPALKAMQGGRDAA